MAWRVFAERLETADLTPNFRVYQKAKMNSNVILISARTWLIFNNDPAFTNITMKIYSNSPTGTPDVLLHSSTSTYTKAQLITSANGVREANFDFTNAILKGSDYYHFVLVATGYTGSASSHLAWKKAYPDPVYRTGLTLTYPKLGPAPYDIYFIGSPL